MEFVRLYLRSWYRFWDIRGRSTRREFWTVMIVNTLASAALFPFLNIIDIGESGFENRVLTAILIFGLPTFSSMIRRFHDIGNTAWSLAVLCVPVIGWFIAIYLLALPGTKGDNRYGEDPGGEKPANMP